MTELVVASWTWTATAVPPVDGELSSDTGSPTTLTALLFSDVPLESANPIASIMATLAVGDRVRVKSQTSTTVWDWTVSTAPVLAVGVWTIAVTVLASGGALPPSTAVDVGFVLASYLPTPSDPTLIVTIPELRAALDVPASAVPDDVLAQVCQAVDAAVLPLLTDEAAFLPPPNVREAGLGIAVQVFHSQQAPGGTMVGLDLNPQQTPWLLGPGLISRFTGLLGPSLKYGGSVIA